MASSSFSQPPWASLESVKFINCSTLKKKPHDQYYQHCPYADIQLKMKSLHGAQLTHSVSKETGGLCLRSIKGEKEVHVTFLFIINSTEQTESS